jgi:Raf kinase inhibitor-like YbhB/YbcL family protein
MRSRTRSVTLAALVAMIGVGCNRPVPHTEGATPPANAERSFTLRSKAFDNGREIPRMYTCDGKNVSPSLEWSGEPQGTQNFALTCDDPDAPGGTFTHWIVYNIPATVHRLPEGVASQGEVSSGIRQGKNDFGKLGYGGPCPPPGSPHHYHFRLYALDAPVTLPSGAARADLENALPSHRLANGEWVGTYQR